MRYSSLVVDIPVCLLNLGEIPDGSPLGPASGCPSLREQWSSALEAKSRIEYYSFFLFFSLFFPSLLLSLLSLAHVLLSTS